MSETTYIFTLLFFSFLSEYLSDSATSPINVDCKTREEVELNLKKPGRYMFDAAQVSYKTLQDKASLVNYLRPRKLPQNRLIN